MPTLGLSTASLGGHAGGYAGGYAGGHAGGHAGDGASGLKLGDAYADSLYADALNKQRAAIIDTRPAALTKMWVLRDRFFLPADDGRRPDGNQVNARSIRLNAHVFRWDAWVRKYLAVSDLIRYLDFELTPGQGWNAKVDGGYAPSAEAAQPRLEMIVRPGLRDGATGDPVTLFSMVRPKLEAYQPQLGLVLQWAELRDERMSEILSQIDNQTPFWGSLLPIQTDRLRATNELLEIVNEFAVFVELRFKHELACWRPTDLSPMVQPMITTPGHGSTPSGHATQSYAVFEVLKGLLDTIGRRYPESPDGGPTPGGPSTGSDATTYINQQMGRIAARIATNRVVAGLHFPVDNIAGRMLGKILGEYFIYRCGAPSPADPDKRIPFRWHTGGFDGDTFGASCSSEDFDPEEQHFEDDGKRPRYYDYADAYPTNEPPPDPPVSLLMNLWDAAIVELKQLELRFE